MTLPALLLHLPDKGKTLESTAQLIEAYCSLVERQGYAWIGRPGGPLDQALRAQIEQAIRDNGEMPVYLFVRRSLETHKISIYSGRLLDLQGPGPNADREHLLKELARQSCSAWLKVTNLRPLPDEHFDRLRDASTGQPPAIWTDLRADAYFVTEGEALSPAEAPRQTWLLCITQSKAKQEFDSSWRFRPVATYQPGSAEFISACESGVPPLVLVYDRVVGSPTRLKIVGVYEVETLVPQGTEAGALVYVLQLRESIRFVNPPTLDPRQADELWTALRIAGGDWEAITAGTRAFLPVPDDAYRHILADAGVERAPEKPGTAATAPQIKAGDQQEPGAGSWKEPEFEEAFSRLEGLMSGPAQAVNERECYQLLRALENAIRHFIDRELSRVSPNWWAEGRVPAGSRLRAEERKQKRENPFPWMGQQDLPTKEYLDFSDYAEIITSQRNWKEVFEPIFIQPEVIRGKLIELGIFRNDIAHMRPLQPGDKAVFVAYAWQLMRTICQER